MGLHQLALFQRTRLAEEVQCHMLPGTLNVRVVLTRNLTPQPGSLCEASLQNGLCLDRTC